MPDPRRMRIYVIRCVPTGKLYVGSASFFNQRKARHIGSLRAGSHHSPKLQNAWCKYGESAFVFEEIECVIDQGVLVEREQFWIDTLRPWFNIAKFAGSPLGVKHSSDVCAKRSEALRAFYSKNKKPPMTDEHRRNIGLSQKGKSRVFSDTHRKALSASATGRVMSDVSKQKMREAKVGRKVVFTDQHKAAIKAAWAIRKGAANG